jgi:hypothetical protein
MCRFFQWIDAPKTFYPQILLFPYDRNESSLLRSFKRWVPPPPNPRLMTDVKKDEKLPIMFAIHLRVNVATVLSWWTPCWVGLHLITNLVVSELNLTCFIFWNKRYILHPYFYSDPLFLPVSVLLILAARISVSHQSHLRSRLRRCASWTSSCRTRWLRLYSFICICVRQIKSLPMCLRRALR